MGWGPDWIKRRKCTVANCFMFLPPCLPAMLDCTPVKLSKPSFLSSSAPIRHRHSKKNSNENVKSHT